MNRTVRVTDHAILQYLQRAHGLDVDAVRRHMAGLATTAHELGAIGVVVENVKLRLEAGVCISVLERRWPSRHPERGEP
ncbi:MULTISPECIES: hypothetical protein [unclassified Ensifer]|uniref:hypothetical protein n=1 Tax=unclassified Ensifer TaxID=2633371 RepID=UPI000812C2ED|nr:MULTISPECIES: hypothetical protein [unclassified Ensifer]OCP17456.1 hypothetical protein BC361_08345 [Ensifer sp. LC54]OCP28638.1 hypothetical protein BC363_02010 [Ensifer sp. LC384]